MTQEIKNAEFVQLYDQDGNKVPPQNQPKKDDTWIACSVIGCGCLIALIVGVGCLRLFGMFARWIFS